jgi:hypothetical protein
MEIEKLKRNQAEFRSLCGLTVAEFEELHRLFSERLHAHLSQWTWDGLERLNAYPQKAKFSSDRLLMMALARLRKGSDQTELAQMFETRRETVCQRLGVATGLLAESLAAWQPQGAEGFWCVETGEGQTIALDATERPVERPGRDQRKSYSVKKNGIR